MGLFKHKGTAKLSKAAVESLTQAQADLREQQIRHSDTLKAQRNTLDALAVNHIADRMFEALSARRGG